MTDAYKAKLLEAEEEHGFDKADELRRALKRRTHGQRILNPDKAGAPKDAEGHDAAMRITVELGVADTVAQLELTESERNRLSEIASLTGEFLLNRNVDGQMAGRLAVSQAHELGIFAVISNPQNQSETGAQ